MDDEKALLQTIKERDAMESAFSKAYELVMGKPMEWSSVYNAPEALADIEERLFWERKRAKILVAEKIRDAREQK